MPKFPKKNLLAAALAKSFRRNSRGKGDKTRINIVSPNLCDDVLLQLSPSLQRHKNCDVIEVNPGAGLWSSKIHQQLRPRKHILLEPDEDLYLPFWKPLLDEPGSRYHWVPWSGINWSTYQRIVDEGLLGDQKPLESNDPRLDQPHDCLLFLANLAYYPSKRYMDHQSTAALMMHQLIAAIASHSTVQAYGLVRMLLWVVDGEKRILLPRTISDRRQSAIKAEMCCITREIAGAEKTTLMGKDRRDLKIDLESSRRVAQAMAENGTKIPSNRQRLSQKQAHSAIKTEKAGVEEISVRNEDVNLELCRADETLVWHEELATLQERFREGAFEKYAETLPEGKNGKTRMAGFRRTQTPEYARMLQLQKNLKHERNKKHLINELMKAEDALEDIETHVTGGPLTAIEREKQETKLKRLSEMQKEKLKNLSDRWPSEVEKYSDDRLAFKQNPPLLLWDRRTEEPLTVNDDEFFPPQKLALLDIQPKPLPSVLRKSPEVYEIFLMMLSHLYAHPKQSIVQGLDSLAPGAVEALIPQVPSLRDPNKGGRRNLDQLRIRSLTPEMLEGLALALEDWPLKPSKAELRAKLGFQTGFNEDYQMRRQSMP
ncbi:MAG: hypothetical protein M1827_000084 [Pycnora praestabilis]|nr:MAG: hypothetical protein M1827_000084 [Pycnora praestabilis]